MLRALLGRLPDLVEMGERALLDAELGRAMALAARLRQLYCLSRARAWEATVAVVEGRLGAAIEAAVRFRATPWVARAQSERERLDREQTASGASPRSRSARARARGLLALDP